MFPCHAGTTCRGSHEYLDIDSDSAADVWRGLRPRPLRAVASIGSMNCFGALADFGHPRRCGERSDWAREPASFPWRTPSPTSRHWVIGGRGPSRALPDASGSLFVSPPIRRLRRTTQGNVSFRWRRIAAVGGAQAIGQMGAKRTLSTWPTKVRFPPQSADPRNADWHHAA
jgi:hypothetical protein